MSAPSVEHVLALIARVVREHPDDAGVLMVCDVASKWAVARVNCEPGSPFKERMRKARYAGRRRAAGRTAGTADVAEVTP
jgi:hypothetical protein